MTLLHAFLSTHKITSCLVAFSGGADSLCLLLELLKCQKTRPLRIEVAHLDHGWRSESAQEASYIRSWVQSLQIPFHQKRLACSCEKGNLEEIGRRERYQFFSQVCRERGLEGVMVAHHQGDLAETTLKRFLEGSPFFKLSAMRDVSQMYGILIWRPFLSLSRQEIEKRIRSAPILPLQDPTNQDPRFLRSRLRHEVLPYLTEKCGKQVQPGIVAVAEEAREVADYFRERSAPFLAKVRYGPLGWWVDWRGGVPATRLEIRYLLRFFLEQAGVSLSREIVERAAKGLLQQEAGLSFPFSGGSLWVDRRQLFLLPPPTQALPPPEIFSWPWNTPPAWGGFILQRTEQAQQSVWEGKLSVVLEPGEYRLAAPDAQGLCCFAKTTLRDWWAKHRVPRCLRQLVPVVWKEGRVVREFLVQDFTATYDKIRCKN